MNPSSPEANPSKANDHFRDFLGIAGFILAVVIGAWLINAVVFRSYNVYGPSMEPTLQTNDRLIVNRLPLTWAALKGRQYTPPRGHIIVFKNPFYVAGMGDEYIVKRVVGLPGEHVTVKNGTVRVYSDQQPAGFDPYQGTDGPKTSFSGDVDVTVPQGEIFVIGDNHSADDSLDSRNGLGTIPLYDVIGPVTMRIFPFNKVRGF